MKMPLISCAWRGLRLRLHLGDAHHGACVQVPVLVAAVRREQEVLAVRLRLALRAAHGVDRGGASSAEGGRGG